MDESQQPVSREMWYQAQKSMADTIKGIDATLKETVSNLKMNTEQTIRNGDKTIELIAKTDRIEKQTTTTNGRVTAIEKREQFMRGGLFIIGLLLVPIAIFFAEQMIQKASEHATIQQAVQDALTDYVVTPK